MSKKQKHIDLEENRYGLFMTENSYNLELMYGRHYLNTDIKHEILLYKINIIESKIDDLYGQTKPNDKSYLTPVKISGLVDIDNSDQKTYGDANGLVRDDTGNLTFTVYLEELKEKNIDFDRGDIIAYNFSGSRVRYYEVFNANKVVDETQKSIGNLKPFYKKIIALPVKEDFTHLEKLK